MSLHDVVRYTTAMTGISDYADLRSRPHARDALDAWVREVVDWHFDPATGCPFWLDYAKKARLGSAQARSRRSPTFARFEPFRGRVAARRTGAALDPEGPRRQAGLRVRDRRHDRHAEDAHRLRRLPHRLRAVQRRRCPTSTFPKGSNWLMLGPSGPRRLRLVGRAPRAVPRRHLLLRRSRSALGDQADQEGLERAPAGLQGPRDRSGGHDPPGRPRHPLHVHHAEAARGAGAAARVDGHDDSADAGITGIFSGGTEFTPQWNRFAHEELLDGAYMTPTYGNTLMGLAASAPSGPAQQLQDRVLRAAAARGHRGRRLRRPDRRSSSTARPAA